MSDPQIRIPKHCGRYESVVHQEFRPWWRYVQWWWCPRCDTVFESVRKVRHGTVERRKETP